MIFKKIQIVTSNDLKLNRKNELCFHFTKNFVTYLIFPTSYTNEMNVVA